MLLVGTVCAGFLIEDKPLMLFHDLVYHLEKVSLSPSNAHNSVNGQVVRRMEHETMDGHCPFLFHLPLLMIHMIISG